MSIANQFRVAYAFAGLFVLIGLFVLAWGATDLVRSFRCVHWPTTEGVIQTAKVVRSRDNNGHTSYSADVSYDYEVADVRHTAKRVGFGVSSAEETVSRYPVGSKVFVHYAPGNPSEAVLETGSHGGPALLLGVGTIFALVGWMMLVLFTTAARLQQQPAGAPPQAIKRSGVSFQLLAGLIFCSFGTLELFLGEPAKGTPRLVADTAMFIFIFVGLAIMLRGVKNNLFSKILFGMAALAFLAVFHWVGFAPGERIGTVTTSSSFSFSRISGTSVKTPFAIFAILLDLIVLVWLLKRRRKLP